MNADQIEPVIASYMAGVTSKSTQQHPRFHENMWRTLFAILNSPDYTTMRDLYSKFIRVFYEQSLKYGFTPEHTYMYITTWAEQPDAFNAYSRAMNLVLAGYKPGTHKSVLSIVDIERTCEAPFPDKAKEYLTSFYS